MEESIAYENYIQRYLDSRCDRPRPKGRCEVPHP